MIRKILGTALCTAFLFSNLAAASTPRTSADTQVGHSHWLGMDHRPLPFQTDAEVEVFLLEAQITGQKEIAGSSNRPLKMTLELGGVEAHAIFRTVDVEREKMEQFHEHARGFRDSYIYEVAAYKLSRLLGLDNVPPAVVRTIEGRRGSLQLWVEQAMGVQDRLAEGIDPRYEKLWLFQKQNMAVFDNLIYNFDRNPGNMLIDSVGKLWFVDHTRSFKTLPALAERKDVKVLERRLWDRLQALDASRVREALDPYLKTPEIDALLKRQKKLVKLIEKRIAQHGEQAILFEFVTRAA